MNVTTTIVHSFYGFSQERNMKLKHKHVTSYRAFGAAYFYVEPRTQRKSFLIAQSYCAVLYFTMIHLNLDPQLCTSIICHQLYTFILCPSTPQLQHSTFISIELRLPFQLTDHLLSCFNPSRLQIPSCVSFLQRLPCYRPYSLCPQLCTCNLRHQCLNAQNLHNHPYGSRMTCSYPVPKLL